MRDEFPGAVETFNHLWEVDMTALLTRLYTAAPYALFLATLLYPIASVSNQPRHAPLAQSKASQFNGHARYPRHLGFLLAQR